MKVKSFVVGVLGGLLGTLILSSQSFARRSAIAQTLPDSGEAVNEFATLDSEIKDLLVRYQIPGASIAVIKNGVVVLARGYGYADRDAQKPVEPGTLFRIASASKIITAAAILKLVEEDKLALEQKAFPLLAEHLGDLNWKDKRTGDITVAELLTMAAGWNKEKTGDPVISPHVVRIARRMHTSPPADFDTTMRWVLTRKLNFKPGSEFCYSNFAYGVLGKIIEVVSGQSYIEFARQSILDPAGTSSFASAKTRASDRLENETLYYGYPGEPDERSIFPGKSGKETPAPYARANMEAATPMFGWVATATDLAKLAAALSGNIGQDGNHDNNNHAGPISTPTIELMTSRPQLPGWKHSTKYFAMGWEIATDRYGQIKSLFKDGTLPGSRAFVEVQRDADGTVWAALFNSRPKWKKKDRFMEAVREIMNHHAVPVHKTATRT